VLLCDRCTSARQPVNTHIVELEPALIARCVHGAGSDLRRTNELCKESSADHLPRNPRWEAAIAHLLCDRVVVHASVSTILNRFTEAQARAEYVPTTFSCI
jgi:hypothetical protein